MRLGVNIDHVATLREARKGEQPDPVAAAVLADLAGADGIVCHLREDRRHIKDKDLYLLKEVVKSHLNLEMAATEEMLKIALDVMPDMVTLVPEKREELTTEGGLDVISNQSALEEPIRSLRSHGIVVSLFVEPDLRQIKAAARLSADFVELHTGVYAESRDVSNVLDELERLRGAAAVASKIGMGVSAGHGLTYHNVAEIARIPKIEELNIGHNIVSRALLIGMERAVREMKDLIA